MRTRCPACGRRPRVRTPARQVCDYCDSRWDWTPAGPARFRASAQARWSDDVLRGRPEASCGRARLSLTLGILASSDDLPAALERASGLGSCLAETVVLLDAGAAPDAALPARTRVHARPLAGHFGDQRTALQRLARTPWVLQLDTDEAVGADTLARLPALLRAAERDGILALGLPRRNLVGGVLSDRYPDPQYRLCRRTTAYEGQVHERPRLASPARQSRLALGLHVEHALTEARVRARTARYGAMSAGATDTARPGDERALLTPFRP